MYGKILVLAAGAAVGYVLGTKRGRADYEMIKSKARELWLNPRVQKAANRAGDFAEKKVPVVGAKLSDAVDAATRAARGTTTSAAGSSTTVTP